MPDKALLWYRYISLGSGSGLGINGTISVLTLFVFFAYQVLFAQNFLVLVKWLKICH